MAQNIFLFISWQDVSVDFSRHCGLVGWPWTWGWVGGFWCGNADVFKPISNVVTSSVCEHWVSVFESWFEFFNFFCLHFLFVNWLFLFFFSVFLFRGIFSPQAKERVLLCHVIRYFSLQLLEFQQFAWNRRVVSISAVCTGKTLIHHAFVHLLIQWEWLG